MAHQVCVQDVDISEARDTGPLGLAQKVQVGAEVHLAIAQPIRLPRDPERRDNNVDALHHPGQGAGAGRLGLDQPVGIKIGGARPVSHQRSDVAAARAVLRTKKAAEIAGRAGDQDGLHGVNSRFIAVQVFRCSRVQGDGTSSSAGRPMSRLNRGDVGSEDVAWWDVQALLARSNRDTIPDRRRWRRCMWLSFPVPLGARGHPTTRCPRPRRHWTTMSSRLSLALMALATPPARAPAAAPPRTSPSSSAMPGSAPAPAPRMVAPAVSWSNWR